MVNNTNEHTRKKPAKQGAETVTPKPIRIGASTPYDFQGSNMTAYGGLLPGIDMVGGCFGGGGIESGTFGTLGVCVMELRWFFVVRGEP